MQTHIRDLYKAKRGLETEWAVQQRDNQRYTLDMVRIDNKIRDVVNQIKLEEAKLANLTNKIEDAAPSVSVATYTKATSPKTYFQHAISCTLQ